MGEFTDKAKGKFKKVVGDLTGNEGLKQEGERDELKGKVEGAVRDVKSVVKDTTEAIKESVKK